MGCKVDRLADRYGITSPDSTTESLDEYLVTRWTGADGQSAVGYKSLTEWFNKRLLRRHYADHGRDVIDAHLDREYELLSDGEGLERDELAADLATDGIDADALERDIVSWSTMRHHLKGCLDAAKETDTATTDWESNTVRYTRERAGEQVRSVLSSLSSKDRLADADEAEVDVQVKLGCPDCSVRVPFAEALERGYVCAEHAESSERDRVTEHFSVGVLATGFPYSLLEFGQGLVFEGPTVVESLLCL